MLELFAFPSGPVQLTHREPQWQREIWRCYVKIEGPCDLVQILNPRKSLKPWGVIKTAGNFSGRLYENGTGEGTRIPGAPSANQVSEQTASDNVRVARPAEFHAPEMTALFCASESQGIAWADRDQGLPEYDSNLVSNSRKPGFATDHMARSLPKFCASLSGLILALQGSPLLAGSPAASDPGASQPTSTDSTEFAVITTRGDVSYTAGSDWKVLSMQTKPPKTAAVFQIRNPADDNTPDSTNVALMTFETDSPDAMAAFEMLSSRHDKEARTSKNGQWETAAQERKQGQTTYSIRDGWRKVPGAAVFVRLGWPHLPKNPGDYDAHMETIFRSLLDSVSGGIGPKPIKGGEVVRRPAGQ